MKPPSGRSSTTDAIDGPPVVTTTIEHPAVVDACSRLATHDIAVPDGPACQGSDHPLRRVLVERGVDPELATGAVPFSQGRTTMLNVAELVGERTRATLREGTP